MDVALFVGFAAKGPVHRPVAIESPTAFAAVFGPDLTLTADCTAALGPAVRAFFANGGTRCHVVRTCRTAALEQAWRRLRPLGDDEPGGAIADTGRFALPGITALAADGSRHCAKVQASSLGSWSDRLLVSARIERTAIPLRDPALASDRIELPATTPLIPGELVELRGPDEVRAFGVVRSEANGLGIDRLEWLSPPLSPPALPDRIDRLRLVLRASQGEMSTILGPFGLTPDAPDNWWSVLDDDTFYADPDAIVAERPPLSPVLGLPPAAWLPEGLDEDWSPLVGPMSTTTTALERDGLARFDAELFLDPRLADNRGASLVTQAQFVRGDNGGGLLGVHAALALPGGSDFAEPSLIGAPDLAQPGWIPAPREPLDPPRPGPFAVPGSWRGHTGPCPTCTTEPLTGPDASGFLDCGTRLLPRPLFAPIEETTPGPVLLQWSPSEPGATYVVMEAGRADMADAVEIWRGQDLQFVADAPRAGSYYYAIHAALDGNISETDVTGVQLAVADWASNVAGYRDTTLVTVQRALLRLCAALGDQFAVLVLPRHYRAEEAAVHRARLMEGFADNELPSLRFGAIYHPWLVIGDGPGGGLRELPSDGAAAGVIARRSRERGAWIGPARVPLADILALAGALADADRDRLATALVNVVAQEPQGFVMTDAMTLSDERDWRDINVRRLVSLLRRTATRRGATYVFEPNGDVLRRVIERSFGHMLDDLVRRGAFSGEGAGDSYRLMIDTTDADRMNGRLVIEIAVAPAQPLRFLTIVLNQVGERLAVVEER
jgi:hypothetical protein